MKRNKKNPVARALRDAMNPIYHASNLMLDRSLRALNDPASVPIREHDRYCAVLDEEAVLDALDYFTAPDSKAAMESEFLKDLRSSEWGISSEAGSCYLTAVRDYQDSGSTPSLRMLKHAVRSYMAEHSSTTQISEDMDDLTQENVISRSDIARIILVNKVNLVKHLHIWRGRRHHGIGDGEVYLKRGLGSSIPLQGDLYQEANWITSYTLALTVAEAFANVGKLRIENLIHLQYEDADNRVLFFTPFVPDVHPNEIEFGLIPFAKPRRLKALSTEGDYEEFEVLP